MSSNVHIIEELGEITGPLTVEAQLDALRTAQTFLERVFPTPRDGTNVPSLSPPSNGAPAPEEAPPTTA